MANQINSATQAHFSTSDASSTSRREPNPSPPHAPKIGGRPGPDLNAIRSDSPTSPLELTESVQIKESTPPSAPRLRPSPPTQTPSDFYLPATNNHLPQPPTTFQLNRHPAHNMIPHINEPNGPMDLNFSL